MVSAFFISSVSPALAAEEEAPQPALPPDAGQVQIETPQSTPTPLSESASVEAMPQDNGAMALLSGDNTGNVNFNPSEPIRLGPALTGTNTRTGAFTYQAPIAVPPGRNGLQPSFALSYNSQDRDRTGAFGLGWSVGIPSIQRYARFGLDQVYSDTDFVSSLSGELVDLGSGSFAARNDDGSFLIYALSGNAWTVRDKKGTTYKFGTTSQSRQDDPGDSSRVFKWMLEEIRDTNDNFIRYEYYKNQGQIYPSKIHYTGNGATDGIFTVEFTRTSRDPEYLGYDTGFAVTTAYHVTEIKSSVSNQWTRKYVLAYSAGTNTGDDLLESITESGRAEDASVVTLPATTFSYQPDDSQTANYGSGGYSSPVDAQYTNGGLFLDFNGDGLTDILRSKMEYVNPSNVWYQEAYTNDGEGGWVEDEDYLPPIVFYQTYDAGPATDYGVRATDVNGDGLTDLVRGGHSGSNVAYLNTGSGWQLDTSGNWNPNVPLIPCPYDACRPYQTVELNGDGLVDFVRVTEVWNGSAYVPQTETRVSTGDGWATDNSYVSPVVVQYDKGAMFTDLNGDGLSDILKSFKYYAGGGQQAWDTTAYLNDGEKGWVEDSRYEAPFPFFETFQSGPSADYGARSLDLNGDGLNDLVRAAGQGTDVTYLNTGEGWTQSTAWHPGVPLIAGPYNLWRPYNVVELNGDGVNDFIDTDTVWNGSTYVPATYTHWSNEKPLDLLIEISYSAGGETDVAYSSTPLYMSGSALLNPDLPYPKVVADEIVKSDALGTVSDTSYVYEGGLIYYGGASDRKFAGFSKITEEGADGNKSVTFFHQGNGTEASMGEYNDHESKIGYAYRAERRDASDNLYLLTVSKWDRADLGSGRSFVKKARETVLTYDGDASHKDNSVTYSYSDSTGNIAQKSEWGEVSASGDGSFTDAGTDKFVTDYSYATGGSYGVTGLASQETVADQSAAKVRETKNHYDTLSFGSVTKGNLTKQELWKQGTSYIDTERTYNSYGLVTQQLDPRDKATSYVYDAYNLYPATVTDAEANITEYLYDYSSGKPKQTTDPNDLVFQTAYDGFDRVLEQKQPDQTTPSTLITKTSYAYTDTAGAVSVHQTDYLDSWTAVDTYSYFDGFNRPIQTRREAEESGTFAATDTVYDDVGRVYKQSLPYFSSGSARTAATTETALLAVFAYDALSRQTSVQNAAGIVTNDYDDWKLTVTDARGKPKAEYRDAYGRLVKVEEFNGGNTYTTLYEYDGNGDLTRITDALSNVRNFTYDGLGRRLTAQDLHASGDQTYGTWSYAYDDSGNMTQSIDPKNQTVNYTYDDINRVLTEDFTGQAGTEVTYTYDTCTLGKPRLCSVDSAAADTAYVYGPTGQVMHEVRTIASVNYQTDYSFDRQGNQIEITNPDGSKVKYAYNAAGQLETVQRKESTDASYSDVVTDFDYGPHGKVTYQANANGTSTTNTYDAVELYRLRTKVTESVAGLGMAALPGGGGTFQATLGEQQAPSLFDIAESDVAREYEQAAAISGKYELERAAFIMPAKSKDDTRIEIGNPATSEFVPELRISRWDEEVSFRLAPRLDGVAKADQALYLEGNAIGLRTSKEEYRFYDISPDADHPEGAYEFEVVLTRKPASNVFTFGVETDNLSFYYQPPLNQEPRDNDVASCSETQCFDANGAVMVERPENMVGSYAVYHSSKQGDYSSTGGHNYRSGKAFHIYRPKIIDAGSAWVWGELNFDEPAGTLSVTVPQSFLDDATYPVIVDPTFGYDTIGGSMNAASDITACVFASPANGNVSSISTYARVPGGPNLQLGNAIYSNNAGVPGALLVEDTGNAPLTTTAQWLTTNVSYGISSGVSYWLAQWSDGYRGYYFDTGGANQRRQFPGDGPFEDWRDAYYSGASMPERVSIYATYTLGNNAPTSPSSLLVEGQTNPTGITDTTPEFSAIYNDPDSGDTALYFQIQVTDAQGVWTNLMWDSGKTAMTPTVAGNRSPEISYAGSSLALDGSTYYWRMKFWDDEDAEGAWSSGDDYFTMDLVTPAALQHLTYTYDPNGNITRIVDASETDTAKTVDYTYDDLNRLLTATTTDAANGQNYSQTFTYDAIGNILSGPAGTYAYEGDQGSSYANPHAATDVDGTAYAYDNNGNLTSRGIGLPWYDAAWSARKQITIDHTKVSGGQDLAAFPVFIDITDNDLKHTSVGGNVGSLSGYDILFTASDGVTKLAHEREEYNGETGHLVAWVNVPVLSASQDTPLVIYYGNGSASDQQNVAGTWNDNYVAVYHQGTGSAGENDSTADAYHLTEGGTVLYTGSGKLWDARELTSVNTANYLYRADSANLDGQQKMTFQSWVRKTSTGTGWFGYMSKRTSSTSQYSYALAVSSNKLNFATGNSGGTGVDTTTVSAASIGTSTWTAVSAVYDGSLAAGSRKKIYLQGALDATGPANTTSITNTTSSLNLFRTTGNSGGWQGQLDEVRVLKTALPPGWIQTEYNNQSSPATFYALGQVSGSSQDTFQWDYRNRMSGSTAGGTTVVYSYDASGQRVSYDNGTSTTYYPTKFYNTDGSTPMKHILANGSAVMTVEGSGSEIGEHYVATDHLTGSNVVTDIGGIQEELMDYFPFGAIRLDQQALTYSEQRKFAGHEYDADTSLTYMNARYYDSAIGRFISQDFMSWTTPDNYLHDPQQWNSYAYARNNPLVLIDIDGNSSVSATVKELFGFISTLFGSRTTNDPTLQVQQVSSNFSRTDAMSENSNLSRVLSTWDPVTDMRIKELDPQVQRPATSFINITEAALDTRLRVTQGYRTIEEQNRLYEQGRSTPGNIVTNVRGGESYHNYGRAIDVVVMEQGQPNWNKPITHDIADLGIDQGFSWGGSWSGFRDYPHFEMPLGRSIEELRSTNESR